MGVEGRANRSALHETSDWTAVSLGRRGLLKLGGGLSLWVAASLSPHRLESKEDPNWRASAYVAKPPGVHGNVYSPDSGHTVVLLNTGRTSTDVIMETRAHGSDRLVPQEFSLGANHAGEFPGRYMETSLDGGGRSLIARTVRRRATPTAIPVSNLVEEASRSQGISTPTPEARGGLIGVVYGDKRRWVIETITDQDVGPDVFIPDVLRRGGFRTQVVILNVGRSDSTADITYWTERGQEEGTPSVTIRSRSSFVLDMREAPRGFNSLQISGKEGNAQFAAIAILTGPNEMIAANVGVTHGASRVALPLLFASPGHENDENSMIRVMKVDQGAVRPRITFRNRDTGERIGPIMATHFDGSQAVLQEGGGYTWHLVDMRELPKGVYSAVVEGDRGNNVAASVATPNMERRTLTSYTGVRIEGDLPMRLVAPSVAKSPAMNSGIAVQNLTNKYISVRVRFDNSQGGRVATTTADVEEFGSETVYLPNVSSLPDNFFGTAELTASGGIAAVVNNVGRYYPRS